VSVCTHEAKRHEGAQDLEVMVHLITLYCCKPGFLVSNVAFLVLMAGIFFAVVVVAVIVKACLPNWNCIDYDF